MSSCIRLVNESKHYGAGISKRDQDFHSAVDSDLFGEVIHQHISTSRLGDPDPSMAHLIACREAISYALAHIEEAPEISLKIEEGSLGECDEIEAEDDTLTGYLADR